MPKKNKIKFEKELADGSYRKIGEFQNQYGETFVIFGIKSLDKTYLITGDEFDWEVGYMVNDTYYGTISMPFITSAEERKEIKSIIEKWEKSNENN